MKGGIPAYSLKLLGIMADGSCVPLGVAMDTTGVSRAVLGCF